MARRISSAHSQSLLMRRDNSSRLKGGSSGTRLRMDVRRSYGPVLGPKGRDKPFVRNLGKDVCGSRARESRVAGEG